MTAKKLILKIIKESPLINADTETRQTKYYELNGERFQIAYNNSNGFPLGFNYKMCLSQYSKRDSKWNNLEDISILDISETPSYCHKENSLKHLKDFFQKMEEHLVTVYNL